ncbi:MAG TPA: hypothetical protein VHY19_03070 [Steroidobacteraceae bacterium]|nr:hypothetical protein [Steroidobacteraceae bacterium]
MTPAGSAELPAGVFRYRPDRKLERPREQLQSLFDDGGAAALCTQLRTGHLHADVKEM